MFWNEIESNRRSHKKEMITKSAFFTVHEKNIESSLLY